MFKFTIILLVGVLTLNACNEVTKTASPSEQSLVSHDSTDQQVETNLLSGVNTYDENGYINVLIEIPTGTREKWELNKETGQLALNYKDGKPRLIKYLPYPVNYGMIPNTLLSKEFGGDGDPLDVIVIGDPIARGTVVPCKILGVLKLIDKGKQDDKLIAVRVKSEFYQFDDIKELQHAYNDLTKLIEIWFTNYKGPGKMVSEGYGDKFKALQLLERATIENKKIP